MIKFTSNELKVMKAIDDSEYGDTLVDGTWSWSVNDNSDLAPRSIGGIVSSLVRKGVLSVADSGTMDAAVGFTQIGAELYSKLMAEQGTPCRKMINYSSAPRTQYIAPEAEAYLAMAGCAA